MSVYAVVLFLSTSSALRAEKTLKRAGVAVKLIPVPRQFSSECGLALRFEWEQADEVRAILQTAGVDIAGVHRL